MKYLCTNGHILTRYGPLRKSLRCGFCGKIVTVTPTDLPGMKDRQRGRHYQQARQNAARRQRRERGC